MSATTTIDDALRSTYQLAGSDAARLRRLTRAAGLDAENVISRLAITRSVSALEGDIVDAEPSQAARSKEIKGTILLGRPRQAALLLALVARHPLPALATTAKDADQSLGEDKTFQIRSTLRDRVTWHWARGLRLLEQDSASEAGADPLTVVARQLRDGPAPAVRRSERGGLGASARDELAAAVGRLYPRWSTEVRRLVSMSARLDPSLVDATSRRLIDAAAAAGKPVTELTTLKIMRDEWNLNRLGLTVHDRTVLGKLLDDETISASNADRDSIQFLEALGLVEAAKNGPRLSPRGRQLGQEALQI